MGRTPGLFVKGYEVAGTEGRTSLWLDNVGAAALC